MIGKEDAKLSTPQDIRTRTDFKQQKAKFWDKGSYGKPEQEVIQFMSQYKMESGAWLDNKTFQFFYDWLKLSCDYYKDILSVNPVNTLDAKYRGMIAGQREILTMLEFMRSHRADTNITQEAK